MNNYESLAHILPEVFLAGYIILLLTAGILMKPGRNTPALHYPLGIAGLAITLGIEITLFSGPGDLFFGTLRSDGLAHLFKLLCLGAGVLFFVFSLAARETATRFADPVEYTVLGLALCLGMMLLAGANSMLTLYLGMELLSLTSYLLTGFVDRDERTTEAAMKYLLYGATASGVMIYGLSLLYGLTGSLDFAAVGAALQQPRSFGPMLFIAFAFIITGLGFKIAAFPFHLWSPDVYEGAPTAFSAFLSVGPKAAGFAVLARVLVQVFTPAQGGTKAPAGGLDWTVIIALISALTMTVGNLAAMPQRNIKRLLAYSSIAHAGYALMALAAQSEFGLRAAFFYFSVYLLMNLAAFLVVILVANEYYTERLDGYEGLGWKGGQGAFLAAAMTIALFSLAGIPPFAGFIGKIYLLLAVIKKGPGLYWLAAIAALNTVLSLYYYSRVVKMMFLSGRVKGAPLSPMTSGRMLSYGVLGLLTLLTLAFGLYWTPLDRLSRLAERLFI